MFVPEILSMIEFWVVESTVNQGARDALGEVKCKTSSDVAECTDIIVGFEKR